MAERHAEASSGNSLTLDAFDVIKRLVLNASPIVGAGVGYLVVTKVENLGADREEVTLKGWLYTEPKTEGAWFEVTLHYCDPVHAVGTVTKHCDLRNESEVRDRVRSMISQL